MVGIPKSISISAFWVEDSRPFQNVYNKIVLIKKARGGYKGKYDLDELKEISKDKNVKSVFIQPSYWFDLGTQEQLKKVSEWLLSRN